MNLLSLYLIDFNRDRSIDRFTRMEKARAWWYAGIILIPLAAIILASHWYGPSLDRVMGWPQF